MACAFFFIAVTINYLSTIKLICNYLDNLSVFFFKGKTSPASYMGNQKVTFSGFFSPVSLGCGPNKTFEDIF